MNGTVWAQQEEVFLKHNYYDLGPKSCAAALGRSYKSVQVRANAVLGFSTYRRPLFCNESFFKDWTIPNSYCFGLLTSDGCMHKISSFSAKQVSLEMTDREVVEVFAKCAGATVKVHKHDGYKDGFCARLGGAKSYSYLWQKGLRPCKSCNETWPSIPTIPLFWSFVRGVFDGDGCVYFRENDKYLSVVFYAGKLFLEQLKPFLESEGIKAASILKTAGPHYRLSIGRRDALRILYEKMYKNSEGLRMACKYDRFKEYFGEIV